MRNIKTTDQISEFKCLELLRCRVFKTKNQKSLCERKCNYFVICSDFTIKQICFPKVDLQKQYDDSMYLSVKFTELWSSPRKWERSVPHSAWQIFSLQTKDMAFGSHYPTTALTRGYLRSINIFQNRMSESPFFQTFLLTSLNALVFSVLALDLIRTRSMNWECRHFFERLNWKLRAWQWQWSLSPA